MKTGDSISGKPEAYRCVLRQSREPFLLEFVLHESRVDHYSTIEPAGGRPPLNNYFFFGLTLGFAFGVADAGGGLAVAASGFAVDSDFTYATTCKSCSSLIWPWNEGIIGPKPVTIFTCGFRIDSRM